MSERIDLVALQLAAEPGALDLNRSRLEDALRRHASDGALVVAPERVAMDAREVAETKLAMAAGHSDR